MLDIQHVRLKPEQSRAGLPMNTWTRTLSSRRRQIIIRSTETEILIQVN